MENEQTQKRAEAFTELFTALRGAHEFISGSLVDAPDVTNEELIIADKVRNAVQKYAPLNNNVLDGNWRHDYSWKQAFEYGNNIRATTGCGNGSFGIDDVAEVISAVEGENDGPSWIMAGKLKDGRYFFLEAGCDYTGWDCQASGDAMVADSFDNLIRFGMTTDARFRFGFPEPK